MSLILIIIVQFVVSRSKSNTQNRIKFEYKGGQHIVYIGNDWVLKVIMVTGLIMNCYYTSYEFFQFWLRQVTSVVTIWYDTGFSLVLNGFGPGYEWLRNLLQLCTTVVTPSFRTSFTGLLQIVGSPIKMVNGLLVK